eukprot:TRINITY_DN6293_c0_g1_i1.p4 TRINITY_DN6293_c0_g1~~TRINITY_DN6293_c0_g1_i1.p4  ORF type:complete len:70 (+),score=10.20 TRINITY_DN6293_c0_g1_i1:371-580(+)
MLLFVLFPSIGYVVAMLVIDWDTQKSVIDTQSTFKLHIDAVIALLIMAYVLYFFWKPLKCTRGEHARME